MNYNRIILFPLSNDIIMSLCDYAYSLKLILCCGNFYMRAERARVKQARWSLSCKATAFSICLDIYLRLETGRKLEKTLWSAAGVFKNDRSTAANDKLMILVSIGNKPWQHLAMIEAGSESSEHDELVQTHD